MKYGNVREDMYHVGSGANEISNLYTQLQSEKNCVSARLILLQKVHKDKFTYMLRNE